MEDYQSNSKKDKEPKEKQKIERVIKTEVLVQKKSLGRKFRDLFIEADFKSVMRYVVYDVLLPAARNTIVDASSKGIERMMYGENAMRRRGYGMGVGQRVTYNSPISRSYSSSTMGVGLPRTPAISSARPARNVRDDLIFGSREEAALVLERMNDIIDQYEVVSVADLNELVGLQSAHTDNKWGWAYLPDIQIRQIREGFLIDLPPAEPIQ